MLSCYKRIPIKKNNIMKCVYNDACTLITCEIKKEKYDNSDLKRVN